MVCRCCKTTSRYRSIARGILKAINERIKTTSRSISNIKNVNKKNIKIYDTQKSFYSDICSYPLPDYLRKIDGFEISISNYHPDLPLGIDLGGGISNQNLEDLKFPSDHFDIVITSDVMEHVRNDLDAFQEIYRVLKKGGVYVFTVPYTDSIENNLIRVQVQVKDDPSKDIFLLEPVYHGDANDINNRALSYRVYGRNLLEDLATIGFDVVFTNEDIRINGIIDTELFYCVKK